MREGNPGVADNRQQTRKRKREKRSKHRHDFSAEKTSNSANAKPSVSAPAEKLSSKAKRASSSLLDKVCTNDTCALYTYCSYEFLVKLCIRCCR